MGSFGAPGFVRLGWPAMTRQPFANAQTVASSFVNADILSGSNEAQERDDRGPLPLCCDRDCHNAISAALLNATRTPVLPRLTRILPPFCALCSANHFMTSGSSLVLPSNSSTPTISSSLRRFTIMHASLKFIGGASPGSTAIQRLALRATAICRLSRRNRMSAFYALSPKATSSHSVGIGRGADGVPSALRVEARRLAAVDGKASAQSNCPI
jgi:hypothetical protein